MTREKLPLIYVAIPAVIYCSVFFIQYEGREWGKMGEGCYRYFSPLQVSLY